MKNGGIGAFRTALFTTTSCVAALAATNVYAQAAEEAGAVEEVVITGSRIVRDGFEAPTPVTVMQTEQLRQMAPASLADGLNQLPQFRGSPNPNTGGGNASGRNEPGANLLSLRNMGPARTLVLLDGRRFISSSEGDLVDINTLPQTLVQRAEVVTGGASAVYGSDAVAGVVNFILDKNFTGLKGSMQAGISTYGDAASHKATLTYGSELFGGRGHVIMAAEYSTKDGVGPYGTDRDWYARNPGIFANPACTGNPPVCPAGQPLLVTYRDGVTGSGFTLGGLVTSGPTNMTNQQFVSGGALAPFRLGTVVSSTLQYGGEGFLDKENISTGLEYYNLFVRGEYDVSDNMKFFAEVSYADVRGEWEQYYNYTLTTAAPTVYASNAYLQSSVASALATGTLSVANSNTCRTLAGQPTVSAALAANDPLRCFKVGRIHSESMIDARTSKDILRIAAGVTGQFSNGWNYEAYINGGNVNSTKTYGNVLNNNRFYAAVDAIRRTDNGQIACAVTVPTAARPANYVGPAYNAAIAATYAACQPFNLFGVGAPSPASLNYIAYDESRYLKRKQHNAAGSVSGELPFSLGYEPVRFAAGYEWRKEMIELTTDPDTIALTDFTGVRGGLPGRQGVSGPFIFGNYQPFQGGPGEKSYSVGEYFIEFNVPLLKEVPLANLLDVDAAYRGTDYSNSGRVETWKFGVVYEPIPDIRFRATRSRDIRGPGADDLFGGAGQGSAVNTNPFTNQPLPILNRTGGNPDLKPEEADTTTYGVVLRPRFLPGFQASLDWYKIEIDGAIAAPSTNLILDLCYSQNQLCQYITPRPVGATFLTATEFLIQASLINLTKQTVEGVDLELNYTRDIGPGRLGIRLFGVYQPHNIQQIPLSAPIDYAGETGISANPKLTANLGLNYSVGRYSFDIQQRYISSGQLSVLYTQGVDVADNSVDAATYTDVSAKVKFGRDEEYEAFVTVNNLFNPDPPFADFQGPSKPRQTWINKILSDSIGRYFTVGVRFKM